MKADQVLLALVERDLRLPIDYRLEFIRHDVGLNWRQSHETPRQRIDGVQDALVHDGPFSGDRVRVRKLSRFLAASLNSPLTNALSVTSRVWDASGRHVGHLALMNLHPEGFRNVAELRKVVDQVANGMPGYLVSSGRYYHFYGRQLLAAKEWLDFLARFLMPCVLVSPRYIGHSLHREFCTLRLNAVPPFKPVFPTLAGVE